ncbi:Mss4-like protein [Trichoderma asperelloides]|nr:Mss4-like protein [Trichoderma asperelloides]
MAEAQDRPNRRTYQGSCHCGAFAYEIDLPELKTVIDCDCSFCSRKGNLYVLTSEDDNFRIVKGSEEGLTSYTFGPRNKIHKFCPKCATSMLSRMPTGPPHLKLLLNARAIQDIDINHIGRRNIFNSKLDPQYLPPAHQGGMPSSVEGGQIYTGSCHCGAVTVALSCKPLESCEERIAECSCGICQRNACIWISPNPENVVLSGSEDAIGRYILPDGLTSKVFCRTCGVNMSSIRNELSEKEILGLTELDLQDYRRGRAHYPINARTLHGVDMGQLKKIVIEGTTATPCRLHL